MQRVTKEQARKLVGKTVYAVRKDGSVASGKLVRVSNNKLYLKPVGKDKGKKVKTKAILPLVLFDLLAIGTLPFWGAGFGGGFGPGFGPGFGGPGFDGPCCDQPFVGPGFGPGVGPGFGGPGFGPGYGPGFGPGGFGGYPGLF
ncbi:hypothetical protein ACFFSY_04780 [Paenibacillus aurantiacus]|uniref:50S ribosomal protein L33 n=1 Tax=Paenibacillus aurantiacus TaxID=1936118 RepID=A0ABV5KLX6_9BACL